MVLSGHILQIQSIISWNKDHTYFYIKISSLDISKFALKVNILPRNWPEIHKGTCFEPKKKTLSLNYFPNRSVFLSRYTNTRVYTWLRLCKVLISVYTHGWMCAIGCLFVCVCVSCAECRSVTLKSRARGGTRQSHGSRIHQVADQKNMALLLLLLGQKDSAGVQRIQAATQTMYSYFIVFFHTRSIIYINRRGCARSWRTINSKCTQQTRCAHSPCPGDERRDQSKVEKE